jgi:hypothetical protein
MDCINSLGEVISTEDVDEMGGVCWTYVRVSMHGIPLHQCISGGRKGAVSVGDTFLFSRHFLVLSRQETDRRAAASRWSDTFALPLLGDRCGAVLQVLGGCGERGERRSLQGRSSRALSTTACKFLTP